MAKIKYVNGVPTYVFDEDEGKNASKSLQSVYSQEEISELRNQNAQIQNEITTSINNKDYTSMQTRLNKYKSNLNLLRALGDDVSSGMAQLDDYQRSYDTDRKMQHEAEVLARRQSRQKTAFNMMPTMTGNITAPLPRTEKEIREAGYRSKYGNKNYTTLKKSLSDQSIDDDERGWLNSYMMSDDFLGRLSTDELKAAKKDAEDTYGARRDDLRHQIIQSKYTGNRKLFDELSNEYNTLGTQLAMYDPYITKAERMDKLTEYNKLKTQPSFSESSKKGAAVQNPTIQQLQNYDTAVDLSLNRGAESEEYQRLANNPVKINNKLKFFFENSNYKANINTTQPRQWEALLYDGAMKNWHLLKADEVSIYNSILASQGKEAADRYLDDMQIELDRRAAEIQSGVTKEKFDKANFAEKVFMNAGTVAMNTIGNPVAFVQDAINMVKGESVNPYTQGHRFQQYSQEVRGMQSNEISRAIGDDTRFQKILGDFASNGYQALMSAADSTVQMALSAGALGLGAGGTASEVLNGLAPVNRTALSLTTSIPMGMGAASSRARELYEAGATDAQIAIGAISSGVLEALFEEVSMDKFAENFLSRSTAGLTGAALYKDLAKKTLVQAGVEASEEVFTTIGNFIADSIIRGRNSDVEQRTREIMTLDNLPYADAKLKAMKEEGVQLFWDAYGGFISGGLRGGASTAGAILDGTLGSAIAENRANKAAGNEVVYNNNVNALVEEANQTGDAKLKALADKVAGVKAEDVSRRQKRNVGKLYNQLQQSQVKALVQTENDVFKEQATAELEKRGVANVKSTVEALTKLKNEEKLTAKEQELVDAVDGKQLVEDITSAGNFDTTVKATMGNRAQKAVSTANLASPQNSKFETSDNNSTILNREDGTSEDVTIDSIESVKNGKMMLNLSNGETVDAKDISFATKGQALLYSEVSKLNVSPEAANEIVNMYKADSGMSEGRYALAAREAYRYGQYGVPFDQIPTSGLAVDLSEQQRKIIYNLGKTDAINTAAQAVKNIKKTSAPALVYNKNGVKYDVDLRGRPLNAQQKTAIQMAEVLSSLGADIHIFESAVKNGVHVGENGRYDQDTGAMYIDIAAGKDGSGKIMAYTLSHEFTHSIQQESPAKFKIYADALLQELGKSDTDIGAMLQKQYDRVSKMEQYKNKSEAELRDIAYAEMVAEATETMIPNTDAVSRLAARVKAQDESLYNKVLNFFKNIATKLQNLLKANNAYANQSADSSIAEMARTTLQNVEQLRDLWADAASDALSNMRARNANIDQTLATVNVQIDSASESVAPAMLSERTWTASDYVQDRENAAKAISEALGISVKKAKAYIDSVNSIAKAIANDRTRLDYLASEGVSSFVGNSEYGGSIDFSTICKKRRLLTGTFSAIQRALPNTALTVEEVLTIRKMMDDKGYEVSCGLCYVEGSRAKMGEYAKDFLEQYAKTNPKYLPNMAEINTPDGIEKIRMEHPEVYEEYQKYMNKLAQRKPKLYQMATEYKGEILNKFKRGASVEEKNRNGGLRLQSFSDFEIIHLIDNMQVIMDMSRVGLAGQAYTKVPDFAAALGGTGLKINLSLIAKGVDENGRLVLDEKEGMKRSDAERLRNMYSDNVGTIAVIFNDEQLKAAMADDFIDYIIPFHRSQWNSVQYKLMGLPDNTKDYTTWQNESYIEPVYNSNGKKMRPDNYMPNTYWDFNKTGKENAEAYLAMCALNNRTPKFSNLLVNNGDGSYSLQPDGSTDGYWKTLIDFKMYNNEGVGVPQMPVVPKFNMDEATRMLDEYKGGHESFPVAQDIVDEFLKGRSTVEGQENALFDRREDSEVFEEDKYYARQIDRISNFDKSLKSGQYITDIGTYDPNNPDIYYSDRTDGGLSNRTLLANALEGTLQNDAEREALGKYKADIARVSELQQHLDELSAQIKDISFSKGKRDMAKLSKLKEDKVKTQNRINIVDKRLLKFESTNVLQKVLEREKAKAIAKTKAEGKKALEEYKAKSLADQQALKDKYKENRAKSIDRRDRTEVRNSIKKIMQDLDKRMNHPTEGKYIPKDMKATVADILSSIDRSSGREGKASEKLATLNAQYKALANANNMSAYAFDDTVSEMLNRAASYGVPLRDMNINQLNDVKNALKAMDHVIKNAVKLNSFKIKGLKTDLNVYEFANKMIGETRGTKRNASKFDGYILTQARPEVALRWFGGYQKDSAWQAVYDSLDAAQKKQLDIQRRLENVFTEIAQAKEAKTLFDTKNLVDVGLKDESGNSVQITRGMMDALYMHLLNDQNARHVMEGGLTVPDMKKYYKGNIDEAYSTNKVRIYGVSQEIADVQQQLYEAQQNDASEDEIKALEDQIEELRDKGAQYIFDLRNRIEKQLSPYDLLVIKAAQNMYSQSQQYLNETTQLMYGFDRATVDNYFPIITDSAFLGTQFDSISADFNLENAGFMKERTNGANPILLSDIIDTAQKSIRRTAQYAAFVPTLKDFNRVFGKSQMGYKDSVQNALENKFGKKGKAYIENLMADLNGGRMASKEISGIDRALAKIRGNMAKSTLTINPRVAFSQSASLPTASAELGYKATLYSLGKAFSKADLDHIAEYSPLLWYRMKGNVDTEIGDMQKSTTLVGKIDKKTRWATGWINAFDAWTVQRLWFGSEYWVKNNTNLKEGTDEFYKAVADKFDKVVERTQPNYTTLQRSDFLRSKNELVRTMAMFQTQRSQNFNILLDAWLDMRYTKQNRMDGAKATMEDVKASRKKFASAVSSQFVAAGTYVAIRLVTDLIQHNMNSYRDDDDELTDESVIKELLNQFGSTIAGMMLFGQEVYDFVSAKLLKRPYYEPSLSGISNIYNTLEDLSKAIDEVVKEDINKDAALKRIEKLIYDISTLFGQPVQNVSKAVKGIIYQVQDFKNGIPFSMEAGVKRSYAQKRDILYGAILDGDAEKAHRFYSDMVESKIAEGSTEEEAEKAISSTVKGDLKEAYMAGSMSREEVRSVLEYIGTDADIAEGHLNFWEFSATHPNLEWNQSQYEKFVDTSAKSGISADDYDKYLDAVNGNDTNSVKLDAINSMNISNDQRNALLEENGLYREELYSSVILGDTATASRAFSHLIMGKTANGMSEEDAKKDLIGDIKKDAKAKYMDGDLNDAEAQKIFKYVGVDDETIQYNLDYWRFVSENPTFDWNQDLYNAYAGKVKPYGISVDVFNNYRTQSDPISGDGKKYKIMDIIDSLPISYEQKDALYYYEGWSAKTINEAPWH